LSLLRARGSDAILKAGQNRIDRFKVSDFRVHLARPESSAHWANALTRSATIVVCRSENELDSAKLRDVMVHGLENGETKSP
jgi:hypothetical protein